MRGCPDLWRATGEPKSRGRVPADAHSAFLKTNSFYYKLFSLATTASKSLIVYLYNSRFLLVSFKVNNFRDEKQVFKKAFLFFKFLNLFRDSNKKERRENICFLVWGKQS